MDMAGAVVPTLEASLAYDPNVMGDDDDEANADAEQADGASEAVRCLSCGARVIRFAGTG